MIVIQKLLLCLKPLVHILVAFQEGLIDALRESLEQATQLLLRVLATYTQLQKREDENAMGDRTSRITTPELTLQLQLGCQ